MQSDLEVLKIKEKQLRYHDKLACPKISFEGGNIPIKLNHISYLFYCKKWKNSVDKKGTKIT